MPKKKTATAKGRSSSGRKASKKKQSYSRRLPFILGFIFSLILAAVLGYSVFVYQNSQEEAEGFFVCDKDGKVCELSQHIHADIDVTICGEKIDFPKEKGSLERQHAHKELNVIHWHARIKVDPVTRQPIDSSPMMLAAFFEEMEQEIPTECSGNAAVTKVFVNEMENPQGLNYVWEDGDEIRVVVE